MIFKSAFNKNSIIGVLRGIAKKDCTSVIEAAMNGGLTCAEITMNTAGASEMINLASIYFSGRCCIGAGTVLTIDQCREAIDSGAQFIVTPNTQPDVIEYCKKSNIPIVSGALTPTEVYDAWKSGAAMVKVFPVPCLGGPEYIRELRGPFDKIPLIAFSGVTIDKVDDYYKAGVNGIGLGSRIFNSEWINEKNYKKIEDAAQAFSRAVAKFNHVTFY